MLESAFEVNLPKIMRAVRESARQEVVLVDGAERTVAAVSETRLAVHLGGRVWMADIMAIPCLNNRLRPLLKCPRAHEGNFQSLYWRAGELACRDCHALRYRSNLAAGPVPRARLAREKLLTKMKWQRVDTIPPRKPNSWRKRYLNQVSRIGALSNAHYSQVRKWIAALDA